MAIDPSLTSTGIAVGAKAPHLTLWKPGKATGIDRLAWFSEAAYRAICGYKVSLVAIEGYAFSSRNSRAHALGELGGVLRLACARAAVPVLDVPPSTLKKFATGKGNASKELVLTEAVRRLGYEGSSTDEADAQWLWLLAKTWLKESDQGAKLPQSHLSALNTTKKGLWKPTPAGNS